MHYAAWPTLHAPLLHDISLHSAAEPVLHSCCCLPAKSAHSAAETTLHNVRVPYTLLLPPPTHAPCCNDLQAQLLERPSWANWNQRDWRAMRAHWRPPAWLDWDWMRCAQTNPCHKVIYLYLYLLFCHRSSIVVTPCWVWFG